MDRNKEIWKPARFWMAFTHVVFLIGIVFFLLLRITRRVEIRHADRIPKWKKNMIIASNHPSYLEALLIPCLFPVESLLRPWKYMAWGTPDKTNVGKWFWFFVWSRSIFVDRKASSREKHSSIRWAVDVLKAGGKVVIHPEGGRTGTGKNFDHSSKGNKLRKLKSGVACAAISAGSTILPIWIEGTDDVWPIGSLPWCFWKKVIITIGEPFEVDQHNKPSTEAKYDLTKRIEAVLFDLADEEK